MAALSDSIEKFIKDLMDENTMVELRRNELAQYFDCAPSQINYVLATRFSVDRGYLVESRRGGSGYVKLIRITGEDTQTLAALLERIGTSVGFESACAIIQRLYDLGVITLREAKIIRAAVSCEGMPLGAKDCLRAMILKNALIEVFKNLREDV